MELTGNSTKTETKLSRISFVGKQKRESTEHSTPRANQHQTTCQVIWFFTGDN